MELAEGTDYFYEIAEVEYRPDTRRVLLFKVNTEFGESFSGDRLTVRANANLRLQPYIAIGFNTRYDKIDLPEPFFG